MTKLIAKAPSNASAYEKRSEYCDRDMAMSDLNMATQLDPQRTYPYRYRAAGEFHTNGSIILYFSPYFSWGCGMEREGIGDDCKPFCVFQIFIMASVESMMVFFFFFFNYYYYLNHGCSIIFDDALNFNRNFSFSLVCISNFVDRYFSFLKSNTSSL